MCVYICIYKRYISFHLENILSIQLGRLHLDFEFWDFSEFLARTGTADFHTEQPSPLHFPQPVKPHTPWALQPTRPLFPLQNCHFLATPQVQEYISEDLGEKPTQALEVGSQPFGQSILASGYPE